MDGPTAARYLTRIRPYYTTNLHVNIAIESTVTPSVLRHKGYKGPIIGVTGNVLAADVEHFKSHGATLIVGKPLRKEKVMDLIREYLSI